MNKIALAALALFAVASAQAQSQAPAQTKSYLLVAAGPSHYNIDCTGATKCNTSATGFKVVGGWQFGREFAAEVGYMTLGTAKISDPGLSLDLKSDAVTAGVAVGGNLGSSWTATARLGLASVNTKGTAGINGLSGSVSERKIKPYAGLAFGYVVSPTVSIEAGVDSTQSEIVGEKGAVRLLSLGAKFAF